MKTAPFLRLLPVFGLCVACGAGVPVAGPDQGAGMCFYGPAPDGIASVPPLLPNECTGAVPTPEQCETKPVCGAQPITSDTRSLDLMDGCSCRAALFPELLDIGAQEQRLRDRVPKELFAGCKDFRCPSEDNCNWFLVEPRRCFQLGFLNGFYMSRPFPLGGNSHDGDEDPEVCPVGGMPGNMTMGAQGLLGGEDVRRAIDLRAALVTTTMTVESIWCRWYGGPVTVEADLLPAQPKHINHPEAVQFDSFKPEQGQRVSLVGDWMTDIGRPDALGNGGGAHSEIHEIRFGAAVKSDRRIVNGQVVTCDPKRLPAGGYALDPECTLPDTWHVLASGFFAKDTAQQDRLSLSVPIPAPTSSNLNVLQPSMPLLTQGGLPAGCGGKDDDGTLSSYSCDALTRTCKIVVERQSALAPRRDCSSSSCPCSNRVDGAGNQTEPCSAVQISTFADFDQCKPTIKNGEVLSQIAFARDIRVDWVDPLDLWNCDCECDDPSAPGAIIQARIQGCASAVADEDSDPEERREACEQACGGAMCGGAPNCRINACRVQASGAPRSDLVAQMACEPPVPNQRVARAGDYRVEIDANSSSVRVGELGLDGLLVEKGHTSARGTIWFNETNSTPRRLDVAEMKLTADDFRISGGFFGLAKIEVTEPRMFILNRMPAEVAPDGMSFTVASFQVKLGARARLDGKPPGGAEFINEAPLRGTVNHAAATFVLDGQGRDTEGHAVVFHLEGHITNRPPTADPGPDRVVECESPTTTSISLDAGASFDGDPGDQIIHYQWFKGPVGLSNQAAVTVEAPLGTNRYQLHVYDNDLASDSHEQRIEVVDTTPPDLTLVRDEWCLWPPNHAFALFKLGREITFSSTDRCDAQPPVVSIVGLESCAAGPNGTEVCGGNSEAVDARGSGSTSPDVRFGPTTACVRSERTGGGAGRVYRATIEAVDSHHNSVRRQIRIVVPHDMSGHPSCSRAEGIDEADTRCER